jgi:hypothetical protein
LKDRRLEYVVKLALLRMERLGFSISAFPWDLEMNLVVAMVSKGRNTGCCHRGDMSSAVSAHTLASVGCLRMSPRALAKSHLGSR